MRAGWLMVVSCGLAACTGPAVVREDPDVIVIVIDTVRADALTEAHTPVFDAIGDAGSSPRAWAASTWTAPSTVSLMTGRPVYSHGWDFPFPRHMTAASESYPPLPPELPTLGEVMQEAGYATVGLYGNQLLSRPIGWERGFDTWEHTPDSKLVDALTEALDDVPDDKPLFAYLHLRGAHYPAEASKAARSRWGVKRKRWPAKKIRDMGDHKPQTQSAYRSGYRAKIEDLDAILGSLLEVLDDRSKGIVVITSDHGEMLGEHGEWGHEHWLWEPLPAVPLAARGLGDLPDPFNTWGLASRIADQVGARSVFPAHEGPVLSQREGRVAVSLRDGSKGIWDERIATQQGFAAFDLELQPDEDVQMWHPERRGALVLARSALEAQLTPRNLTAVAEGMTEETLNLLEELGYMDQ